MAHQIKSDNLSSTPYTHTHIHIHNVKILSATLLLKVTLPLGIYADEILLLFLHARLALSNLSMQTNFNKMKTHFSSKNLILN